MREGALTITRPRRIPAAGRPGLANAHLRAAREALEFPGGYWALHRPARVLPGPAGIQAPRRGPAVSPRACTRATHTQPAPEVTAAFGAKAQRLLAAAVHEAGHAVVAETAGAAVTRAGVCQCIAADCDGKGTEIDLRSGEEDVPLSDLLAVGAAGYLATHIWLQSGGIDGTKPPYDAALSFMAGDDIRYCLDICRQRGRPDLGMHHGIEGARAILVCRWQAVSQLSYSLSVHGVLAGAELHPYLSSDPVQRGEAVSSYRAWQHRTRQLWQQKPG